MYRESYQRGLFTIFYSCGSKPLNIWDTYTQNGYISKFLDEDIKSTILEIGGTNVSTTYIICPKGNMVLGITMPFLVMVVKNLKKYFSFEITILDDTGTRRRFRVSNFQSTTQIFPLCTVMPINLSEGWNQIQFNLADFCRKAYKKQFVEVQKLKINANIRLRRVYFADRILPEDQLPAEYKLFIPLKLKPGAHNHETVEKVVAHEEEKLVELKKRDSKSASASKVSKAASVVKSVSQVQAFEERKEQAPVGTAESGSDQSDVATEDPIAGLKKRDSKSSSASKVSKVASLVKTASQMQAFEERKEQVPIGTAEGGPDQSDVAAEVPVTDAPLTEAPATEAPITQAQVVTDDILRTEETATETTELVKEKSVEAAVQTEGVVIVVDAPVEDVAT